MRVEGSRREFVVLDVTCERDPVPAHHRDAVRLPSAGLLRRNSVGTVWGISPDLSGRWIRDREKRL